MLTNALGMDLDLEVEDLAPGDVFVLTTDGVHDVLTARQLRSRVACALAANGTLEGVSRAVVDAALQRGSEDNLSCLLMRVDTTPDEDIDKAHRRLTRQVIPPVLRADARIDGYRVVRAIANGTRSHIYLVEDPSGRRLALKAPSESFAEDAVYLDGFIREEWIGKRIDHPGVMKACRARRAISCISSPSMSKAGACANGSSTIPNRPSTMSVTWWATSQRRCGRSSVCRSCIAT